MDRPARDDPQVLWRVGVLLENLDALPAGTPPTPRTRVVRHDLFPPWERPDDEPAPVRAFAAPARKKRGEPLAEGEKHAKSKTEPHADYGVRKDLYLRHRAKLREESAAAWVEGAETAACAGCGDAIPSPHHYCGPCLVAQDVVRDGILSGDAPERDSQAA